MSDTWLEAVNEFVDKKNIPAEYALEVFALRKMAEALDKTMRVGMVQQFGLSLRNLRKQLGDITDDGDELDNMLDNLGI